jgi:DNA polymerase III, epsilon subunit and related 3''-5'' exonucleases
MEGLNFIAIDFETATPKRASICEVSICVVRNGKIIETKSWLVQPEDNAYAYWNIRCHGIQPEDTENAPSFPEVWAEIERDYLDELNIFVAHNAAFDRSCLERSAELYGLDLPELQWECSLLTARRIYDFGCNSLGYLCEQLGITEGTHHRAGDDAEMCARLFLKENKDNESTIVTKI